MLNVSLRHGEFPDAWRLGLVTPLPKTGDLLNANNWRPITQIPLIGKLLEKVVNAQLQNYLDIEDILSKYQFGFRKNKSTTCAVFKLITDLFEAIDKKETSQLLYIDYKKAFDTVDHTILLGKLQYYYNLDVLSLKWFSSYLSNRKQQIVKADVTSEICTLEYGVPQVSVLGPTLFIMYVNDIFQVINKT